MKKGLVFLYFLKELILFFKVSLCNARGEMRNVFEGVYSSSIRLFYWQASTFYGCSRVTAQTFSICLGGVSPGSLPIPKSAEL